MMDMRLAPQNFYWSPEQESRLVKFADTFSAVPYPGIGGGWWEPEGGNQLRGVC